MKKNNFVTLLLMTILLLPKVIYAAGNCGFVSGLLNWAQAFWNVIVVMGPVLFVVMSLVDLAKTLTSGEDAAFKKFTGKTVKRLVAVVVLMLLPILIQALLTLIDGTAGTCGIE